MDEEVLMAKVASYWVDGREWKWELLADLLPLSSQVTLASCIVETNEGESDQIYWLKIGSKRFEVKSAYALENWNREDIWRGWSMIWRL